MSPPFTHPWGLSPKEAIRLQQELAPRVVCRDVFDRTGGPRETFGLRREGSNQKFSEGTGPVLTVAGADIATDDRRGIGFAAIILFEYPTLRERERVWAKGPLSFPYIPGLLSFREGPILLRAFEKLKNLPDLILFDGQGIAHPRRFGIASHMGLLLDRPSIGCAKSLLCGTYKEPGLKRGSWTYLKDKGETIGAVLRTRDRVKPIFVSIGHRVGLKTAIRIVLACHDGVRIPKPTREADRFSKELRKMGATFGPPGRE